MSWIKETSRTSLQNPVCHKNAQYLHNHIMSKQSYGCFSQRFLTFRFIIYPDVSLNVPRPVKRFIFTNSLSFFHGKIHLAYETTNEALEIAEKSGDMQSRAMAYTYYGASCYSKGFFKEACKVAQNSPSGRTIIFIDKFRKIW